jgi:SAM-dependent methyltransferase
VPLVLPVEADYPETMFRSDLAPELRVGCGYAYFRTNPVARRLFRERIETALAMLPRRRWRHALDAGTGAGFLLPSLASLADAVVGADISPVMRYTRVMLDNRGVRNVRLHTADLLNLPYPPAAFDLILCLSVIEHIPDLPRAFAEMDRVLTRDGAVILGYPLEHSLFRLFEWLLRKEKRLRRIISRQPRPRGAAFHPHTSDYRGIEAAVGRVFVEGERRTVSFLGLPVYRILRLTPR